MPPRKKAAPKTLPVTSMTVHNSFADSVLGLGLWGGQLGFAQNIGTPVHQLNTLFRNNRGNYATNQRFELNQLYTQQGIVQALVDVPVDDALKGGWEIKSKQLEPEQIEIVQYKMEEQDDIGKLKEAGNWMCLFGGSGLIVATGLNKQEPFDPSQIEQDDPLDFIPADMWELPFASYKTDAATLMGIGLLDAATAFNYYGETIHRSHVLTMKGLRAPSLIRPRFLGWGVSVVEGCIDAINQYLKAVNLLFEVLDEFKIDYYKIKNLNNDLLNPQAAQALMQRLILMNQAKDFQNAAVMDSEDDFIQKLLNFAGFSEIFTQIRMQFAAAVHRPMSKIFGIPSSGFSSGEDDIENYNDMIDATIRPRLKPVAHSITQLRCQQMFGFVPDDLRIGFKPLRTLSAEQQENVKTQKFSRVQQAKSAGDITMEEYRDSINKDELLPVQLDKDVDENELKAQKEESRGDSIAAPAAAKSSTEAPEAKS